MVKMKMFDKKTIKNGSIGIIAGHDVNIKIVNISSTDREIDLSTKLVHPRHYRSQIALDLFKLKDYTLENLTGLTLSARTIDELQFSLRFSRGTSHKISKQLIKNEEIQNHVRNTANSSIQEKDYLSLISLVSVCSALSLDFGLSLLDALTIEMLPKSISNLFTDLRDTLKLTKAILSTQSLPDIKTPLRVFVDTNNNTLIYRIANSSIEHTVYSPQLLWDCNCDTNERTSFYKIEKRCKIHGDKEGVIISLLMGTPHIISINNLEFLSYSGPVWPPSIDSLIFLKTLSKLKRIIVNSKIDTLVDIGCGVGVLGIYFRYLFPTIKKCIFIDSDHDAISLTKYNYTKITNNDPNAHFIETDFVSSLDDLNLGNNPSKTIALCLPPYLPYPGTFEGEYLKKVAYNGLSGLELLQKTINGFEKIASYAVIGFSKMASKFVFQNHNTMLKPIHSEYVPLRIPSVLHRPDFLEWLSNEKLIDMRPDEQHMLWHKLTIYSNLI